MTDLANLSFEGRARRRGAARVAPPGLWLNEELAMRRDEITQAYVEPIMPSHRQTGRPLDRDGGHCARTSTALASVVVTVVRVLRSRTSSSR
jgi:hypothetical protein